MTPLVSLNFEDFDPKIDYSTFFNSYEWGHCDPLNRKLRENPGHKFIILATQTCCLQMLFNLKQARSQAGVWKPGLQHNFFQYGLRKQMRKKNKAILEALERLYCSTGLIFLQRQKKFLTIIIQSLHFSSLKKKGMEKTCEKRRKKW